MANKINDYIKSFPDTVQVILKNIRQCIKLAAPEAEEIINYGIPTFKLNGNLVHFAAHKNHIGFYPTPSAIEKFKNELSEYETAKGSIIFPLNNSIPYDLITEIVKFRVNEQLKK